MKVLVSRHKEKHCTPALDYERGYREVPLADVMREEIKTKGLKDYLCYHGEEAVTRYTQMFQRLEVLPNLIFHYYQHYEREGDGTWYFRIGKVTQGVYDICKSEPETIFMLHGLVSPGVGYFFGNKREGEICLQRILEERTDILPALPTLIRTSLIDFMLEQV